MAKKSDVDSKVMTKESVTAKVDETPKSITIQKKQVTDLAKVKKQEINSHFKSVSEIFRFIRKYSNTLTKEVVEADVDNEDMRNIMFLIINNGWLSIFTQWHNQETGVDENNNPVKRYKTEPSTPAMMLNRMKKMVKEVYDNVDDKMDINEKSIRKILDV